MTVELRRSLHKKIISHLDTRNTGVSSGDEDKWRNRAEECLQREMKDLDLPEPEKERLRRGTLDEIFAYGPLTRHLQDPSVSEIMVNGKNSIYIEREGKVTLSETVFLSEETLRA